MLYYKNFVLVGTCYTSTQHTCHRMKHWVAALEIDRFPAHTTAIYQWLENVECNTIITHNLISLAYMSTGVKYASLLANVAMQNEMGVMF